MEIASRSGQTKPVLLARDIIQPNELRKEDVANAASKAQALEVDPYTEANVVFFNTPNYLEITEWDGEDQVESTKHNNATFHASGQPVEKLLIIRAEWNDAGPATYVAKVRIKKIYSYQYSLSEDPDKYTVMKFLPDEDEEWNSGPTDNPMYETRLLGGELPKLQSTFPELNISKLPSYFVFHKGVKLLATDDEKELESFLTQTTTVTHSGKGENWKAEFITKHKLGEGIAVLAIQSIGTEKPLPREISLFVEGTEWTMDQYIEELDAAGQVLVSFDFERMIRNEDKISLTMKWSRQEETIYLTHTNNGSSLEPKVSIKAKVSKLTDEQYADVGTTGLENPKKDDFRYFTFNLKTSNPRETIQQDDLPTIRVFREAIDKIDGKSRYWFGNGYGKPDGEEHWEAVFYSKGLTEEQIKKAFDSTIVTVHFTDGKKEYKLGDYVSFED